MAHSEQVRVTKQELRKALNSRVTAGLGEDKSERPTSGTEDFLLQDLFLSQEQFCETQTPRGSPHIHETKAVQPCFTCWRGRVGSTEYDFLTRKCKENLFFTFGSITDKKQFQDPRVAKSKTKVPQGMGTRGCSQVTSKLNPQGRVSLEEFRMSEQPRQHIRAGGLGIVSSQAKS